MSDDGLHLVISVTWTKPLCDVAVMHKMWLESGEMELFHPCIAGFEHALHRMRERVAVRFESSCKVPLPFQVDSQVYEKSNMCYNGMQMHLRPSKTGYATKNDEELFVEV